MLLEGTGVAPVAALANDGIAACALDDHPLDSATGSGLIDRAVATRAATLQLAAWLPAAQENEERGALWEIQRFSVDPADFQAFSENIQLIVEAAEQAGLTQKFGWRVFSDFPDLIVVSPVESMADFDDPNMWMRQFEDTPGQAKFGEAMQTFGTLNARLSSREIIEEVADWTYTPATGPMQPGGAHVSFYWLKPNMDEEFDALVKDFIAFLKELDSPYQVIGHRVRFGDPSRVDFVTVFDNIGNFYGVNDLEALVEKHGAGEKYGALVGRFVQMVEKIDEFDVSHEVALSYWPNY